MVVNSFDFFLDGNFLLSGSEDNIVKIWNLEKLVVFVILIVVGEKDWVVIIFEGYFDVL